MELQGQNERISWVDTLKFLGIFAVYVGHFADVAGLSYPYVYTYHVPLFFFVSGFFAVPSKEISLLSYIKKNIISILIPYFVFNIITLIALGVGANFNFAQIKSYFPLIFSGIRDKLMPAYSLWFLPCMFLMKITYFALYKLVKKKALVLFLSIAMMYFAFRFFSLIPLFFNINYMFLYIFYYSLGASTFTFIKSLNYYKLSVWYKFLWWFILVGIVCLSLLFYFQKTEKIFKLLSLGGFLNLQSVILPIIGIILNIYLSFWISKLKLSVEFGKKTLMFCGNEQLVNFLVPCAFSVLGIKVAPTTPLSVYLYTIALLACVYYILVPIEQKLFPILRKTG